MPELPEVETVLQALKPHLLGEQIVCIVTYIDKLRTPLELSERLELLNSSITSLSRRAKYIILRLENHYGLLIHLGMTGSWRLETPSLHRQKHDHVEILLSSGLILRYNDPRRFGQVLVLSPEEDSNKHSLLEKLGPEPLGEYFDINWLSGVCKNKKKPIKNLIMDNSMVVGVGNIYASESLFRAGINPLKPAGKVSKAKLQRLVTAIKKVLQEAISAGGTTIRDYTSLNGEEGYFTRELKVYGKTGEKCQVCKRGIVRKIYQSGRSTFYCPICQR